MQCINIQKSSEFIDRREYQRSSSPLTTVIGNTPYAIENWSFSGFKIASYYGILQPPRITKLKILVPTAGPGALFQTWIETVRYESSDVSLSVKFRCLGISNKRILNRYFQEHLVYTSAAYGV
ncbi:MAG: hypothetical protein CMM43_02505 [Rhodospirillaceae bacterium]|nr:hypothetical protein [Rhodospirillaceae bacterium]